MTVLSSCSVPDEFLKMSYHAFCLCHSTEITLVEIMDSSTPILLRNTSISDHFLLVKKKPLLSQTNRHKTFLLHLIFSVSCPGFPLSAGPLMLLKTQPWTLLSFLYIILLHNMKVPFTLTAFQS